MQIADGTLIDKRFRVIRKLGVGGMGAVFEADQLELDRVVAIKILSESAFEGYEAYARFEREAQVLSQLRHKNIVAGYAFGRWNGLPYMVMERVKGTSLQQMLESNKPLKTDFIIKTMIQACSALEAAHSAGIIHRDLKPSNLLIDETGELKIIDFGLAKVLKTDTPQRQELTEAGTAVGSVLYMSPEQCQGKKADPRSDIYALGCVMHHCRTGVAPFLGDHSVVVMMQHVSATMPRCGDPQLQPIIDNATAKDPEKRYQSMADMRADLEKAEDGQAVAARVVPQQPQKPVRVPAAVIISMLAALVTAGAVGWYLSSAPNTVHSVRLPRAAAEKQLHEIQATLEKTPETDRRRRAELNLELAKGYNKLNVENSPPVAAHHALQVLKLDEPAHLPQVIDIVWPMMTTKDERRAAIEVILERASDAIDIQDYERGRQLVKQYASPYLRREHARWSKECISAAGYLLLADKMLKNKIDWRDDVRTVGYLAERAHVEDPEIEKRFYAVSHYLEEMGFPENANMVRTKLREAGEQIL